MQTTYSSKALSREGTSEEVVSLEVRELHLVFAVSFLLYMSGSKQYLTNTLVVILNPLEKARHTLTQQL